MLAKLITEASGEHRAKRAGFKLLSEVPDAFYSEFAQVVGLKIIGDNQLTIHEVDNISEIIYRVVDAKADIYISALIDEEMQDGIKVNLMLGIYE